MNNITHSQGVPVEQLLKEADENGDDMISYPEFKNFILKRNKQIQIRQTPSNGAKEKIDLGNAA